MTIEGKALAVLVKDGEPQLFVADSAHALSGDRQIEPFLEELARDEDPEIRAQVARVIPELLSERTRALLTDLFMDDSPLVSEQAKKSTGKIIEQESSS
jgi:HEAT repeat protein